MSADPTPTPFDPSSPETTWSVEALLSRLSSDGKPAEAPKPPADPPKELCWTARYDVQRLLGSGGQGVVYLARREGVDGYDTMVALKMFFRPKSMSEDEYRREMERIARQAQLVSRIQHDNIISIRDFVSISDTRVMVAEWVDGLDLSQLLDRDRYRRFCEKAPRDLWERLNDVIVTEGKDHCRLKSGVAVDILRGCLAGLASLHHFGIAHCDLKPSNIMVKRTGTKKIIDMDSSCHVDEVPAGLRGTPYYMAPEQHRGRSVRLRSDVASLGYILIEMLTGQKLFRSATTFDELLAQKKRLPERLDALLPREVRDDALLHGLIDRMIAPDADKRFADADAAEFGRVGAVSFHRHLVKQDLDTEYDRELAWWLDRLADHDELH